MLGSKVASLLPIGLVLLAAGLRFFRIGEMSLWYDEAFGVLLAKESFWSAITRTAVDTLPPLYYVVLQLWSVIGTGEFVLRMLSALFGIASVALLYRAGATFFGQGVGLIAGLFGAISPFQVFYSQEIRMYSLLGLLSVLGVLVFYHAWQTNLRVYWVGYGLVAVASLYTHTMGAVTILALLAFAAIDHGQTRRNLRGLIASHCLIVLLYLPWLYFLPAQVALVTSSFWMAPPSPLNLLMVLYTFVFGSLLPLQVVPFALGFLLVTTGLSILLAVRLFSPRPAILCQGPRPLLLVAIWLAVPLLITYAASLYKPMFLDRALISSAMALYILLAWGISKIEPRPVALALLAATIAFATLALSNWYFVADYAKPPMRDAASYVGRQWKAGDVILHTSDGSQRPFLAYIPALEQKLLFGDPDFLAGSVRARSTVGSLAVEPEPLDKALYDARRVWLIVALDHSVDWQRSQKAIFDASHKLVEENDFKGIGVFLYSLGPR